MTVELDRANGALGAMEARVSIKDFVAIFISFFALIVSVTGAYFSFFWAKDDIGVDLGNYPGLYFSGQIFVNDTKPYSAALGVSPEQSFTFINNGTRPASIVSVSFYILSVRKLDKKQTDCLQIDKENVIGTQGQNYSLEPFSIKPGEIIIKNARIGSPKEKAVWFEPEFAHGETSDTIRAYACIEFAILVPGRNLRHVAKVVSLREEKGIQDLLKQDAETFGISRDIQRGPWARGALIPLISESHLFGSFQTADPNSADYGLMGCACGDQNPVMETYLGESDSAKSDIAPKAAKKENPPRSGDSPKKR